ncbi:hypothetical protein EDC04DRAFT_2974088 [Pisolithus marmoratus]|nr:hypothetical protein EDC04DRAFT_2974088 [Pisolithus marmoratus]
MVLDRMSFEGEGKILPAYLPVIANCSRFRGDEISIFAEEELSWDVPPEMYILLYTSSASSYAEAPRRYTRVSVSPADQQIPNQVEQQGAIAWEGWVGHQAKKAVGTRAAVHPIRFNGYIAIAKRSNRSVERMPLQDIGQWDRLNSSLELRGLVPATLLMVISLQKQQQAVFPYPIHVLHNGKVLATVGRPKIFKESTDPNSGGNGQRRGLRR